MTKVKNPESGRLIDVDGGVFKKLMSKYQYDVENNILIPKTCTIASLFNAAKRDTNSKNEIIGSKSPSTIEPIQTDEIEETKVEIDKEKLQKALEIKKMGDENYEYIVHISDVHILLKLYNSGRADEFRQVFDNLYKKVKLLKTKYSKLIIAMTGDILDTKINSEPEMSNLAVDFFDELSKISKVILICGNHDINEYNLERSCTLRSLLYKRNLNVDYLEYSGLYQYGNAVFVVSSLKDRIFIHYKDIDKAKIENKMVIALYHGLIKGAKLHSGYDLTKEHSHSHSNSQSSRYRTIEDFDGFDMVLLGDIHEKQLIKPNMAYAGSLLQLKADEGLEHGILLWNMETKTPVFYQIKNDYGHVYVKIKNGEITEPLDKSIIPIIPTFHCILENTTPIEFKTIKTMLAKDYNAKDIKQIKIKDLKNLNTYIATEDQQTITLQTELDQISKLVTDSSLCKKLQDLHVKIYDMVKGDESTNYNAWDVISVEFKNMFIFGNNKVNSVYFNGGVSNICAANFAGKSSLASIIIFALFDKTNFERTSKTDIINKKESSGYVKLVFRYNNERYLIEKTVQRMKRSDRKAQEGETYKTYFYRLTEKDEKINLTDVKTDTTCKLIQNYVGTFENFITNSTLLPRMRRSIISMTPSERLKAILKLMRYERCEKYKDADKKMADDLKIELGKLNGELECINRQNKATLASHKTTEMIDKMKAERDQLLVQINEHQTTMTKNDETRTKMELVKFELEQKLKDTDKPKPTEDKTIVISQIAKLRDKLKSLSKPSVSIDLLIHQMNDLKTKIGKLSHLDHTKIDVMIVELEQTKPTENEQELLLNEQNIREKLCELKVSLKTIIHNLSKLPQIEQTQHIQYASINLSKEELKDKKTALESKLKPINEQQTLLETINRITTLTNKLDSIKHVTLNKSKDELQHSMNELQIQINVLKKDLVSETECSELTKTDNIEQQIIVLTNEFKQIVKTLPLIHVDENKIKKHAQTLLNLEQEISTLNKNKSDPSEITKQLLELKEHQNMLLLEKQLRDDTVTILKELKEYAAISELQCKYFEIKMELNKLNEIIDKNNETIKMIKENEIIEHQNKQIAKWINYLKNCVIHDKIIQLTKEHAVLGMEYNKLMLTNELNECMMLKETHEFNAQIQKKLFECDTMMIVIQYKELNKEKELLEDAMNMQTIKLSQLESTKKWNKEYNECIDNQNNCKIREKLESELNKLTNEHELLKEYIEMERMEQVLEHWNMCEERDKSQIKHNEIVIQLNKIKMEQSNDKSKHTAYNKMLCEKEMEIKSGEESNITQQSISNRMSELTTIIKTKELETMIHKKYQELFNKKGIPMLLIGKQLEKIEQLTNEIFSKYTKYRIKIVVEDDNLSIHTEEMNSMYNLNVDRISSSEDIILNMALKMACNKISPWGRSMMFIIDETLDCIDKERWDQAIPELLEILQEEYMNVLFITQREISNECIDNKIMIKRHKTHSEISNR